MIGRTVSHYHITAKLGKGGIGEVYLAEDSRLGRQVALKFLSRRLADDRESLLRFRNEARAAAELSHPSIATLYDIDEVGDDPFLVMEYLDGLTLRDRIAQGPLPVHEVLSIGKNLTSGLAHAHAHGIIHRDIKSTNIMFSSEHAVKILDFGLARQTEATQLTAEGIVLGTVAYMSPEQFRGEDVDARTDLWSLGVVLYECLTGLLPFSTESAQLTYHAVETRRPQPITALRTGIPLELERVIFKCLQSDRSLRYQHADDLLSDLRLLEESGERESWPADSTSRETHTRAGVGGPPQDLWRRAARVPRWILTLTTLVALVGILFLGTRNRPQEHRAASGPSIAVLRFQSLSTSPEDERLAETVSGELIAALSQYPDLRVSSGSTALQLHDNKTDLATIGQRLSVTHLVEGTIRSTEDHIYVTARLIDVRTGFQVFGRRFEGEKSDLFALQDSVAFYLGQALNLRREGDTDSYIARRWIRNSQAYAYYLTANNDYWNFLGPEGLTVAADWHHRALALDSQYAPALAGLALVRTGEPLFEASTLHPAHLQDALSLSRLAQELDPQLGLGWAAQGRALERMDSLEQSHAALQNGIENDPRSAELHYFLSDTLARMGRREEALKNAQRCVDMDPRRPLGYWQLVRLRLQWGEFEKARGVLEKGLSSFPQDPLLLYQRSELELREKHFDTAIKEFRQLFDAHQDHYRAAAGLANALGRIGRKAEADSVFQSLVGRWPQNATILQIAGAYARNTGAIERSLELLLGSIAIDPENLISRIELLRSLQEAGRFDEAEAAAHDLAQRWPKDPSTSLALANFYRRKSDPKAAQQWVHKALNLNPHSARGHRMQGLVYTDHGQLEKAAAAFTRAIFYKPDSSLDYSSLCWCNLSLGNMDKAIAAGEKAVRYGPSNAMAWINLGSAYLMSGKLHQAAVRYEEGAQLSLGALKAGTLNNLAIIYTKEGRFRRAIGSYERAAEADTNAVPPWQSMAYTAWNYLDDTPLTLRACNEVLRRDAPEFSKAVAHTIQGEIAQSQGRSQEAEGLFSKAKEEIKISRTENPKNLTIAGYAIYIHAVAGSRKTAIRLIDEMLAQDNRSSAVLELAALTMARLGELDSALEYLEAAIAAGFENEVELEKSRGFASLRSDPRFAEILQSIP